MDDGTGGTAENAMVLVLSANGKTYIAALAYAMEFTPVVPAARFLADIPTDRSLSTELRASYFRCSPGKAGVKFSYERTLRYLGDGRQGPDPEASLLFADTFQLLDATYTDRFSCGKDLISQAPQQVRPSGVDPRIP
jgi:hypothetical protein